MPFQDAPCADAAATLQHTPNWMPDAVPRAGRVLVVEDDEVLCRFLERMLRNEGFEVQLAHTGAVALGSLRPEVDLIVLDLNLPELDGIAVLQAIRSRSIRTPVLVLTARSRHESAVLALESGADDCLTKPFAYTELLARLRALLRRSAESQPTSAPALGLRLNPADHRATLGSWQVDLTPREFALLAYLTRSPGVPVTRTELLREIWGESSGSASNVVDVYMKYLRDKLDASGMPRFIRTVRGIGYVYDAA